MKKSEIINLLDNLLKTYEDCSMSGAAKEVLELIEELGMSAPSYFVDKRDYGLVVRYGWEPEGITPKRRK